MQMSELNEKIKLLKKQNEGLINNSEEIIKINNTLVQKVQNEILEEIHDTVCQDLFNIVCSLHALSNSWSRMTQEEVTNNLNLAAECSRDTLSKLRSIVYRPILANKEQENFIGYTSKYISSI
jgi:signal transduction histidine kinase